MAHACFACACKEENIKVSRARIINRSHFVVTLAILLLSTAVTSAAPVDASASPILSNLFRLLVLVRTVSFYTLIAISPILTVNTVICPPRKIDHTKPPKKCSQFDCYGQVLADCLKIPTVSHDETSDEKTDHSQIAKLKSLLEKVRGREEQREERSDDRILLQHCN